MPGMKVKLLDTGMVIPAVARMERLSEAGSWPKVHADTLAARRSAHYSTDAGLTPQSLPITFMTLPPQIH